MKNITTFLIFAVVIVIAAFNSGCNQAGNTNSNAANTSGNKTALNTNAAATTPEPTAEKPDTHTIGSLATPTDAYKTAYELRKNKNTEGLKKIMSKDIIEFLTMMGEEDTPKKTLDQMIAEMFETPQADKAEARNEKINGDRATVEYLTKEGDWKTMDFEKVDGKWLLSFPKAEKGSNKDIER